MAKTLVLAEKPSVGREIARVLGCRRNGEGFIEGDRYIVTWALGHLVTLSAPDEYDKKYSRWAMDDLPMLPEKMKLTIIKETSKQYRIVSGLMKRADVSELVVATDSGREGELVARWIILKAGFKKPIKRLWISSQTDRAIKEGFAALKPSKDYDNLFKSAQARSQADWLVGLNVTRALTCKHNAQLSAGRVQTPTLALIVKREEEIRSFVPKDYWTVSVNLGSFTANYRDKNNQSRIYDRAEAEKLAALSAPSDCTVTSMKREGRQKPPPAAYDLTELQRDANKRFAYTAKETLSIMQSLYERHKVLTYPRTDSRYITRDVADTIPERLRAVTFGEYAQLARELLKNRPVSTKYIVNDAKVTDHHAIIPTEQPADYRLMTGPEQNIYDLVVRRFLAVLMPPHEYDQIKLELDVKGNTFTARGNVVREQGWHAAYGKIALEAEDDEPEAEDSGQTLPDLKKGDKLKTLTSKVTALKTRPPSRYTEATLLSAMEHPSSQIEDRALGKILEETSGLGTPATRADIIERLFSAFYIERNGKELAPTSKGIQLVGLAPPDLRSAELTAKWEQRLSQISRGQEKDADFIAEMKKYTEQLVKSVCGSDAKYSHDNLSREKCPDCGKNLLEVGGKRGKMLVCPDRECGYRKNMTTLTNARCPNCHKKMELRGEGEGRLFTCVCGFRERLSDFEKKRTDAGAGKADVQRYLASQKDESGTSALADQLKKWQESQ